MWFCGLTLVTLSIYLRRSYWDEIFSNNSLATSKNKIRGWNLFRAVEKFDGTSIYEMSRYIKRNPTEAALVTLILPFSSCWAFDFQPWCCCLVLRVSDALQFHSELPQKPWFDLNVQNTNCREVSVARAFKGNLGFISAVLFLMSISLLIHLSLN